MTWEECVKQYDKLCWKMVNKYKNLKLDVEVIDEIPNQNIYSILENINIDDIPWAAEEEPLNEEADDIAEEDVVEDEEEEEE